MNREIEKKIFDMIHYLSTALSYERRGMGLLEIFHDVSKDLRDAKILAAIEIQEEVNNEKD
jgi:hypothetical protein